MSELYLQHHGTKGQRWGVRRYQNEDGSLTDEGRKRYSNESAFENYNKRIRKNWDALGNGDISEREYERRNEAADRRVAKEMRDVCEQDIDSYYDKEIAKLNAGRAKDILRTTIGFGAVLSSPIITANIQGGKRYLASLGIRLVGFTYGASGLIGQSIRNDNKRTLEVARKSVKRIAEQKRKY